MNLTNPGHHGSAVIGEGAVEAERKLNEELEQAADTFRAELLAVKRPLELPRSVFASGTIGRTAVLFLVAHERVRPGGARSDVLAELDAALQGTTKRGGA